MVVVAIVVVRSTAAVVVVVAAAAVMVVVTTAVVMVVVSAVTFLKANKRLRPGLRRRKFATKLVTIVYLVRNDLEH